MDVVANSKVDSTELYFLVAKFLEAGPCQRAAKVLSEELHQHQFLPRRKNWLGEERQLSYKEAVTSQCSSHIESDHLQLICSKLVHLLEEQRGSGLHSLLGAGLTASIQNKPPLQQRDSRLLRSSHEVTVGYREQPVTNLCHSVSARQFSPAVSAAGSSVIGPQLYTSLKKHCAVLGHLAPVFCVLFDLTGQCIITGADDDLLKVWSSRTGQLLATLRGHSAEVTDLSLSCDNTMVASGSIDKSVRVWCTLTSAPIAVLMGHQSQVTSVQFSPSPIEECRYLASTGKDGFLCFWQWLPDSNTFNNVPAVKFMEKNRMGDQTLCSSFSSGGKYFVTGGTDCIIRVYVCIPGPPTLQAELTGHTDRIMTVQFGHTGQGLFATGSCDGSARVWRFKEQGWTSTALKLPQEEIVKLSLEHSQQQAGKFQVQVTMVGWETTDSFLMTALSPDCSIRVWNSSTGELTRKLDGHTGEVFVLESHPSDSRVLLSAGHDGLVILWDMLAGVRLTTLNLEEDDSITCIFDCKFSPDGLTCAAADSSGYLTVMGLGSSQPYGKHPKEQFFHTDYHPLMRDRNHYVVDEQSQLPPHLLPPPYLVDIDGHAHTAAYQEAILRLVRPVERVKQDRTSDELEDYDEYMKKHLARVRQHRFRFGGRPRGAARGGGRSGQGEGDRDMEGGSGPGDGESSERGREAPSSSSSEHHSVEHSYASSSRGGGDQQTKPVVTGSTFLSPMQERSIRVNGESLEGSSVAEGSNSTAEEQERTRASSQSAPPPAVSEEGSVPAGGEPAVNVMDVDERDGGNMMSSVIYSLGLTEDEAKRCVSLWHNRTVIPPLDSAHLSSELARRQQLYREENENYQLQNNRRALLQLAKASPVRSPVSVKGPRSLRSGRTLPDPSASLLERGESVESEGVLSESSGSEGGGVEEELWEESSDSSYISDWTTEAGINFISPAVRKRRKTRKRNKSSEHYSGGESSSEEEGDGPSRRAERRRERAERRAAGEPSPAKPTRRPPPVKPDLSAYHPSDWVTQTRPQLSPYRPQVGDIVVYCWQGHECYMNAVRREKAYSCKNLKLPWQKYTLLPQEFCQVTNVRYLAGTPTLCSLTLALLAQATASEEEHKERITFTFKYHDMDGVLDFLVLGSLYKASILTPWTQGDRFRSLIDEFYWYGKILSVEPFSEDLPGSYWQCYRILWDDGATDQLSPWDMEPLPDDSEGAEGRSSKLLAAACEGVWGGGEGERERIERGLEEINKLDEAYMFREPVDYEEVPTYCRVVAFPTSLSTIRERLGNGFYRSKLALLWEVALLLRNAQTFNQEDSLIVEHAKVLVQTLWKFINDPAVTDPLSCYEPTPSGEVEQEVVAPELTFVAPQDILPLSSAEATSHLPSNTAEQSHDIPALPWVQGAEELLERLRESENALPFVEPVSVEQYKDYLLVVHQPMDLGTVGARLQSGAYTAPSGFTSDVQLVFKNAKTYNRKGSEVYEMAVELESVFEVQVLDFLKACRGDSHSHHGTRRALASISTLPSVSESTTSSVASTLSSGSPQGEYRGRLRSASSRAQYNGHYSSGEGEGESVDGSVSSLELGELTRRTTRSMAARTEGGQRREEEGGGYGMTLRKRGRQPLNCESEDSDDWTSPSSRRRRSKRAGSHSHRKRRKVLSDSEEEEEEEGYSLSPVVVTTSRSGRVVRPVIKGAY